MAAERVKQSQRIKPSCPGIPDQGSTLLLVAFFMIQGCDRLISFNSSLDVRILIEVKIKNHVHAELCPYSNSLPFYSGQRTPRISSGTYSRHSLRSPVPLANPCTSLQTVDLIPKYSFLALAVSVLLRLI